MSWKFYTSDGREKVFSSSVSTSDPDAIHDNADGEISLITEKTTPVAADLLLIEDSAASNAKKKVQAGNLATTRIIEYRILDKDTAHTVTAGLGGEFRIPIAMTVVDVGAYVDTAGVTGTATIDIHDGATTIMTTNKISIETGEKTSLDATTQPAITDSAIAADAIITFDIDVIQTTAAKGLVVWLKVVF